MLNDSLLHTRAGDGLRTVFKDTEVSASTVVPNNFLMSKRCWINVPICSFLHEQDCVVDNGWDLKSSRPRYIFTFHTSHHNQSSKTIRLKLDLEGYIIVVKKSTHTKMCRHISHKLLPIAKGDF